ncbi:MAG: SufD family Fe-S cluster assembly protein [Leptospiraceae bacterium]|nr:SufD family Fe-S cluster assembly protein [Leptospiraceae bacterium]
MSTATLKNPSLHAELAVLFQRTEEIKEPFWLKEFRRNAFHVLQRVPIPNASLESWRKLSLSNLKLEKLIQHWKYSETYFTENRGNCLKRFSELNPGEEEFLRKKLDFLLEYYSESFFSLLNFSFFTSTCFLELSEKNHIAGIFSILENHSEAPFLPLNIIKIGKFAKAVVKEETRLPANEDLELYCPFTALFLEDSANIDFISLEQLSDSSFHFKTFYSSQEQNSHLNLSYFNLDGYRGKTFFDSDLRGEGANIFSFAAIGTIQREVQDVEFSIRHLKSYTTSKLLMKAVVRDKSHHIFTGKLWIPAGLKHVQASQLNNNLILDPKARAESIPCLEVFSEDVSCSHGATMGEIKEEELFYLMSRGLNEEEARALILEGFLASITDKIPNEKISSDILESLLEKLNSKGR